MPLGLKREDGGNRKQTGEEELCQETSDLIYEMLQSAASPAATEMKCNQVVHRIKLNKNVDLAGNLLKSNK